ncbi:flagellar hook protein FlgE [Blastococcus sp. BMG 814]|uniref:Flagellar hook protein FlgE n=1 Tax=Blastococcus carthaginiensis TaxID=3050034 RepID=A0ABT9IFG4_9ACTN|nr:flagellar hook protein FlgE [Blastococcus carthaginiensis]MDP5184324.1 flagellar hook protein FlgE [Blastococcus carthaginiensis]
MLRSMFSAISGLRAHQTKMDVTGNNIANVNTVGFKSSATVFQDTLSQVVRAGGQPAADRGGTNPAQIGLGVKLAGITTNWTNGAAQSTGRSTDFMIEGDGFFVVEGAGGQQLFTRAGSFDFDASGKLVTPDGSILQGWVAQNGVVNANGPVEALVVPYGQIVNPTPTTAGSIVGNLPSDVAAGTTFQVGADMYDSQGVLQKVAYNIEKLSDNNWEVSVVHSDGTTLMAATPIAFDAAGNLTTPAAPDYELAPFTPVGYPSWTNTVTMSLAGLTQFGGANTLAAPKPDGYALGSLQSFTLSNDGTITGVYSNGLRQPLGQLAMASFNNPSGLEKAGNSSFRVGDNSGVAMIGLAGQGGRGELSSGALEMSNVDLSEEFTGLIVAQRGFQANSRVITASDEILQDLVNLKR